MPAFRDMGADSGWSAKGFYLWPRVFRFATHYLGSQIGFCRGRWTKYGGRSAYPHLGAWVRIRGGQRKAFTSGPVCSASLHTTWSPVEEQAPKRTAATAQAALSEAGGRARPPPVAEEGRARSGSNRERRVGDSSHALCDHVATGARKEKLVLSVFARPRNSHSRGVRAKDSTKPRPRPTQNPASTSIGLFLGPHVSSTVGPLGPTVDTKAPFF